MIAIHAEVNKPINRRKGKFQSKSTKVLPFKITYRVFENRHL